jgi:TRAP-type C4-dicarboxylate transport system substrate-binding protein
LKCDRQTKEALLYAKGKVDKAQGFIEAIKQRRHTLTVTMKAIINWQRKFFQDGDESDLKPMILQAMKEATEYERKLAAQDDDEMLTKLNEYAKTSVNFKIHTLSQEQKVAWQKEMDAIYSQFYSVIGEDLIKKVQAVK